MQDLESIGKHCRNGSFRLVIWGLSLNQNRCDPDTIPPWALNRGTCVALLENQGESNFQAHIYPSFLVNKRYIEVVGDIEESGLIVDDDQVYQEIVRKGKKKLTGEGKPTSSVKNAELNLSPNPGVSLQYLNRGGYIAHQKNKGGKVIA